VAVFVVVLLGASLVSYVRKATDGRSAFLRWRPQITALVQGENIYAEEEEYPNTPIVAIALYPLVVLPPLAGAISFFLLKVGMTVIAATWAIRMAIGRRAPPPAWAVGLILLLAARPIMSDLQHGNINLLVLFLVIAGLWVFTRGRPFWRGVIIGVSVVVKVTPGLFIPYFAWKRQWAVLLGCAAGIAAAVAAPAIVLGPETNLRMHHAWFQEIIAPFLFESAVPYTEHINQSLPGVWMRLTTYSEGVDPGDDPKIPVNLLSLDPRTASLILRGMLLTVVGWLAYVCRTRTPDRRDWRLACEFGLILIGMLILSERTWKHHFVTITLPIACAVMYLVYEAWTTAMRRYLIATLVGFFALTALMSGDIIGWIYKGIAHKFVEAYGSFFLAGLLLFAALSVIVLRNRTREDIVSPSHAS